jgi:D-glycero-alpha-D-manno-heptose-7-phosphate kinase
MQVTESGSVRVDLVGGTLDIEPINLILKDVWTLNVATGLKAQVSLEASKFEGIEIHSEDYNKSYHYTWNELTDDAVLYSGKFQEMTFVLQIIKLFKIQDGLKVNLKSGAPAGSGLGGSSAMGVTLYKALCQYTDQPFDIKKTVARVKGVESRILNQGVAGYQDYFPALVGGVLALQGIEGDVTVEQNYSHELKTCLESNIALVYSGLSRASGINNWEVYKGFFDKRPEVVQGLTEIAKISADTREALKNKNFERMLTLIGLEGEAREKLFPSIVTDKIRDLADELIKDGHKVGLKMCGAGGGGCFILVHFGMDDKKLNSYIERFNMKRLDFKIEEPLYNA